MLDTDKLHGDDTPLPVLAPGTGRTKTGRFWTYVRDNRPAGDRAAPAVWFAYSPNRKGEHPQQHLAKFQGILRAAQSKVVQMIVPGVGTNVGTKKDQARTGTEA